MNESAIGPFDLADIRSVAQDIIHFGTEEKIWIFEGQMGAGKTTLISHICKLLSVTDTVTSPTYAIVNEYETQDQNTVYHFDFYRIRHETEALDIGIDEYFSSGHLCLIEWPSKIYSLIPGRHLLIDITLADDNKRNIFLKKYS